MSELYEEFEKWFEDKYSRKFNPKNKADWREWVAYRAGFTKGFDE